MESLVGKRFAAGGLRVYFAGIHSLFAFILLTNKIMIMFCIGAEYIEHCSDGWFYFFIIQKRENEENFGWMSSVVNSGEAQVKQISTVVLDISYHWALITTHLTSQKVQQPAVMSKTYVANGINERCLFLSLMAWFRGVGLRDIDRVTQFTR